MEKTAIQFFQKKDYMHETVDKLLCNNMYSSNKEYKADLDKKKFEKLLKQKKIFVLKLINLRERQKN